MATTINEFRKRLEDFIAAQLQAPVEVTNARQLTGGASRESWAVDINVSAGPEAGQHVLVLRRDMGGVIQEEALTREQEFRLLEVVYRAGVLAPRPCWLCTDPAVLGLPFFLMDRIDGESVGRRIVREQALAEARRRLPRQMGEQLARIHTIGYDRSELQFLGRPENDRTPAETALDQTAQQLWRLGEPHPALELAIRWLRQHLPACPRWVLIHGDFRIGNLLVGTDGLRSVIDWEFAHVGDPAEDLSWPCVRSWRFGQDGLRLGGVGQPDEFLDAYNNAGGSPVGENSLQFWEILGNLRWAVGCVAQANRHLSGQTQNLELASLGRRTAEMELEVLDLIEEANR
jgi:aminoglycoside phosphotransferase (APT) family kinase protein